MRWFFPFLVFVFLLDFGCLAHALETKKSEKGTRTLAIGVFLHDRGPFSDRFEDGIDLNLELEFAPMSHPFWRALGSPSPHVGTSLNFVGDTSIVYAGITYQTWRDKKIFGAAALGLAVHNGPLHKDPERCERRSDCGFGSRFLPRIGVEAGVRLTEVKSVTIFYDHVSHGGFLADENEGIDHLGLRYRHSF